MYRKFVQALEHLWTDSERKPKRIHVHMFESLHRPHAGTDGDGERELSLNEAIALLVGKKYEPVKITIWNRLDQLEHLMRNPTSLFAAKTAAAVSVYAVCALASSKR